MRQTNKSKIEEKDEITDYLKSMTDEEREIANLFKIINWNSGVLVYKKDSMLMIKKHMIER